jgi:hypothetical protein
VNITFEVFSYCAFFSAYHVSYINCRYPKNYPHPEWIITANAFFDNDFYAPNSYFKNIVIP